MKADSTVQPDPLGDWLEAFEQRSASWADDDGPPWCGTWMIERDQESQLAEWVRAVRREGPILSAIPPEVAVAMVGGLVVEDEFRVPVTEPALIEARTELWKAVQAARDVGRIAW